MRIFKGGDKLSEFKITMRTDLDDSAARSKINKLMADAKKEPIKITADASSLEGSLKNVLSTLKQVQSASKNLNLGGNSNTKGISSTITQFKSLTNQYNALQKQLSKETNPKSMDVLKNQIKTVGASLDSVKQKISKFGSDTEKALMSSFSSTATQKLEASYSKTFSSISSKAKTLETQIQSAFNNPNMNMSQLNSLQTRFQGLQNLIKNFDMSKMSGESLNGLQSKLTELQEKMSSLNTTANQTKLENKFNIDCSKTISQLEQLKSKYASIGKDTSGIDSLISEVQRLQSSVGSTNLGTLQGQLKGVNKEASSLKSSLGKLGSGVKSTFGQIVSSFSMLAPGYLIGSSLVSGIRTMKEEVLNLDKAMTNLIKVADDSDVNTSAKLKGISDNAANIAKEVAGSVSDVVNSMAEASKMGIKGMEAVQEVAKYSQIFANVGDMNINDATEGIATVINAFNVDPLKEYSIEVNGAKKNTTELANAMDIMNHAGNNYAISVGGVLEAMQNGGSTMSNYGLSIQETTALITAANEALQNPNKVGNGLKSLTNNLAGLTTSAKTGEIKLNKTAMALEKIAKIDIFTDKSQTEVKSMTTLLDEVNEKWGSLSDTQRKALSNAIGGKQQSAVFQSLMNNYDTYKQMMSEYANGDQFNSALNENAKYIDSIEGRLASLKATWTQIATTVFNSNMIKSGVSGLDTFSQGIETVISTIDKLNIGIPVAIASIALLKTAFSSFRYAESFSAGLSLIGMKIASIPESIAGIPVALSAFTGLNITMLGLVGTIGAVAAAFVALKGIQAYVDYNNTKATRKWDELTKSVNKHKKALKNVNYKEANLNKTYSEYEKLAKITNKTKEEQKEYNNVLQKLSKIDPDLVVYDEKGSPVKARSGEVKDLIREYQKAQREQQKLLNRDLKDKADTSFDKYKEQAGDRNKRLLELEQLKRDLLQNENKVTGQYESKLSGDWLTRVLAGNTESIKYTQQYFKNLEEYKKKEQEVLDSITQQRENVSKDQSDWLGNLFNTNDKLEGVGKNRQKALENALKLDFSQFDKDGMESLGNKLNEWFSTTDYKNTGKFNKQIDEVNRLNQAWKDGDITSRAYKTSVDDIASTLSKLTGGKISTEEFAKMLKLPEFDVESANKTFSDLEEAQNTLKAKIADMGVLESPKQRLELAYDIIQDEKVPEEIKNKVAEFASDGNITDEELKLLLNLTAELKDDDLENTINEKIDKLSEEKEVTQKVAIKYAMEVDSASDNNQYLEELLGDANLAMDIQMHMDTNDLDLLKEDLRGIPTEKQVGIIVSAINSGKYTPEELQGFIKLLPEQKQVDIITAIQKSGSMTPEEIKELINGLPDEVKKQIKVSTPGADESNNKLEKVDKNSGNKKKQVKTSAPGADETISKEKQVDKNSGNKKKKVTTTIPGGMTAAQTLAKINARTYDKKQTITTIFKTIGKTVSNFFGGGYQPPIIKNASEFSNISDMPQETTTPSATESQVAPMSSTFSAPTSTPTEGASPSATSDSGNQVSAKSVGSFGSVLTSPTQSTKISKSYKNVLNMIKYGINLFQELENRISRTANQLDLLSIKMENAVGTKKISYLKQQNTLYKEQAKLQKTLFNSLYNEKQSVQKKLKKSGFTLNRQGNLTSYEEKLLKLEKEAERAEKASSNYKGKNNKTKNRLEKNAESAKKKLDEAKSLTEEYLSLQYKEIPAAEQEWANLQNAIKENNNEIEKLKFADKIHKEQNAIEKLNASITQYKNYADRSEIRADNTSGKEKIKNLKSQLDYTKELVKLNNKLISQSAKERGKYKNKLREYGAKFDINGQLSNQDALLNKYQNSENLDKIKDWIKEYNDLYEAERDVKNETLQLGYSIEDLNNEVKKLELENKVEPFTVSVGLATQNITKLNNELDILDVKLKNAVGKEKIDLLDEQVKKWQQLKKEQEKVLKGLKSEESTYQKSLSGYGFKFDKTGNMTNKDSMLSKLKNHKDYEYIKDTVDKWEELYNDSIPNANKSILEYENSVRDAYQSQLDITKDIEDKITNMYKDQIEKRKDAIKKETETITKELEKQRKAYKDMRDEVDYQNDYKEKTDTVSDLQKQLEIAKKDTSLSNRKKIADLEKQLADAQKDLDKFVQDKIDSDIDNSFQESIDKANEDSDKKIEDLENLWSDSKIAEAVKDALKTGLFTDIDGEVSNLKDSLLDFAETSGELFGVTGDIIANDWCGNLDIALNTMNNLNSIMKKMEVPKFESTFKGANLETNSLTTGDISINISAKTNSSPEDIGDEVAKKFQEMLNQLKQGL